MEHPQKGIIRYDVYNPNLDIMLTELVQEMTEVQRINLPKDITNKLFRRGNLSIGNLRINEKMYLLSSVFKRQVAIVVSGKPDSQEGVNPVDFTKMLKASKGKASTLEVAEELYTEGVFVIGDKDLMESIGFSRLICCTDIWRTVIPAVRRKPKLGKITKFEEHRRAFKSIVAMYGNYESNKRRITMDFGFSMPEWYAMLHFYDSEKKGTSFYADRFKLSLAASRSNMKNALTRLVRDGYLSARGGTLKRLYTLTAKGEEAMLNIFDKIVLNY